MKEPKGQAFAIVAAVGKGAVELIFYFPLLLTASVYLLPGQWGVWWMATLIALYAAPGLVLRDKTPSRRGLRLLLSLGLGISHAALIWYAAQEGRLVTLIVCGVLGAWVVERGFACFRLGWMHSFPAPYMLAGVFAYIAMQPLQLMLLPQLASYDGWLHSFGIAAIMLFLLIMNERHLARELIDSGKTSAASASRRQNRLLVGLLAGLMLLFAVFRQVQSAIEQFFGSMMGWLLSLFGSGETEIIEEQAPQQPMQPMLPPAESNEQPAWMEWITKILMIAVTVVVIILVAAALYWLFKKLYRVVKKLIDRLTERQLNKQTEEEDYTDEVESLMTLMKWRNKWGDRLKEWGVSKSAASWNDGMTNNEKARFLYKRLVHGGIKEGYEPKAHLTPRETAQEVAGFRRITDEKPEQLNEFIASYEEARYGTRPPSDADIDRHRSWLEQRKSANNG